MVGVSVFGSRSRHFSSSTLDFYPPPFFLPPLGAPLTIHNVPLGGGKELRPSLLRLFIDVQLSTDRSFT